MLITHKLAGYATGSEDTNKNPSKNASILGSLGAVLFPWVVCRLWTIMIVHIWQAHWCDIKRQQIKDRIFKICHGSNLYAWVSHRCVTSSWSKTQFNTQCLSTSVTFTHPLAGRCLGSLVISTDWVEIWSDCSCVMLFIHWCNSHTDTRDLEESLTKYSEF